MMRSQEDIDKIAELEAERDALAAHMEAIDIPVTVFIECSQEAIELLEATGDAPNIASVRNALEASADKLAEILSATPATSLARLKAQWQAEALKDMARDLIPVELDEMSEVRDRIRERADKLRRQAEEA